MLTRRNLLILAVVVIVLFVIALPGSGTISSIAWVLFLIGVVVLIVLSLAAFVQARRQPAG
jgi:Ca2+/Na+ antiporter